MLLGDVPQFPVKERTWWRIKSRLSTMEVSMIEVEGKMQPVNGPPMHSYTLLPVHGVEEDKLKYVVSIATCYCDSSSEECRFNTDMLLDLDSALHLMTVDGLSVHIYEGPWAINLMKKIVDEVVGE